MFINFGMPGSKLLTCWTGINVVRYLQKNGLLITKTSHLNIFSIPISRENSRNMALILSEWHLTGIKSAIIREKGVNGDREMAYILYMSGMDVKDVHMTDLISGAETLEDVNMIVFVGGFSNSDVLGSAKGWAGAFLVQ